MDSHSVKVGLLVAVFSVAVNATLGGGVNLVSSATDGAVMAGSSMVATYASNMVVGVPPSLVAGGVYSGVQSLRGDSAMLTNFAIGAGADYVVDMAGQ